MHGKGKFLWKNGKTYDGEFKNNLMHGFGVYTWPDGKRYEGNFH